MEKRAESSMSMNSMKGVMLCNRPQCDSTFGSALPRISARNGSKSAFVVGIASEPLGYNVPLRSEALYGIKRDKKDSVLSKHKKWLFHLQQERDRLKHTMEAEEKERRKRKQLFMRREALRREAFYNERTEMDDNEHGQSSQQFVSRPMWALTKETAADKEDWIVEDNTNQLIDFASNLDIDAFMEDVEHKACAAQVEQQLNHLQSIVDQEEAEEKRYEILASHADSRARNGSAQVFPELNGTEDDDDDVKSVTSTVLSECKSVRSVHSTRSLAELARRVETKLDQQSKCAEPRIVTIDEEEGSRMKLRYQPGNLPYIRRNPAV